MTTTYFITHYFNDIAGDTNNYKTLEEALKALPTKQMLIDEMTTENNTANTRLKKDTTWSYVLWKMEYDEENNPIDESIEDIKEISYTW